MTLFNTINFLFLNKYSCVSKVLGSNIIKVDTTDINLETKFLLRKGKAVNPLMPVVDISGCLGICGIFFKIS